MISLLVKSYAHLRMAATATFPGCHRGVRNDNRPFYWRWTREDGARWRSRPTKPCRPAGSRATTARPFSPTSRPPKPSRAMARLVAPVGAVAGTRAELAEGSAAFRGDSRHLRRRVPPSFAPLGATRIVSARAFGAGVMAARVGEFSAALDRPARAASLRRP